ncbi:hypothetical protein BsWGS_25702 [Bradybaena similaris]
MIKNATVSLLVLALGWAAVEGFYVNDFDQDARLECPANQIFSFIGSIHSNPYEDRRWEFRCRPARGATSNCHWTNYVNEFEQPVLYNCPGDEVLHGMMSYHHDGPQDRRFMFQCCDVAYRYPRTCSYTIYVNYLNHPMNYHVPVGMAIKGAYSYHDNSYEDRQWQFNVCYLI